MSKGSKARSKQERLNEKRKRRQANKARYAALRQAGENSKSVRFLKNNRKTKLAKKTEHVEGYCGNFGCNKCVPKKLVA